MYTLNFSPVKGFDETRSFQISDGDSIQIGRSVGKEGENSPLLFKSKVVSRNHAFLKVVNGELCIQDNGSSSGTFLNGSRINPDVFVKVENGDLIRLGGDCELNGSLHVGIGWWYFLKSVMKVVFVEDFSQQLKESCEELDDVQVNQTLVSIEFEAIMKGLEVLSPLQRLERIIRGQKSFGVVNGALVRYDTMLQNTTTVRRV